jgi:hypothetical protein
MQRAARAEVGGRPQLQAPSGTTRLPSSERLDQHAPLASGKDRKAATPFARFGGKVGLGLAKAAFHGTMTLTICV